MFGRAVRLAISISIRVAREKAISAEIKIIAVKAHPHSAGDGRAKRFRGFGAAVAISVKESFDITAAGDDYVAMGIEGHGVDVVGDVRICVLRDAKAGSNAQAQAFD